MSATIAKPSLFLLVLIIVSMAIAPAFALGDGNRNLLLIGVMAISPLILLGAKKFNRSYILLILFMLSIVLFPPIFHPESVRWSTVLYSLMFGVTFMAYVQLLYKKTFTLEMYLKVLKYLIYAYAIVLVIQQFCVLTGLPIFNLSNYDPMEPWKLNSLAAEPSHSARIVALLMFCYISMKEILTNNTYDFRKNIGADKWVWISFLWTMFTMGSGTAFLFIGIVLLKFVRFKTLISLAVLLGIGAYLVQFFGITAFDRTYSFFIATLTLDPDTMVRADHSASLRIIPMIYIANEIDLTTVNGWFGHGIDYTVSFLSGKVPGVGEGFTGGGLFQLLFEYGFISFILFLIFSFTVSIKKGNHLSIIFWFLLIVFNGVNSQIGWLTIILLFTGKYFELSVNKKKRIVII